MEAPTARWGISLPTHAIRTPGHDEQQDKMDNNMLVISNNVALPDDEMEISAIRAQGAGGQNVNKVATAIHLRFDIRTSSLPDFYKERLLSLRDKRITGEGVIIIKAQRFRTQEKNREDALERLSEIIRSVTVVKKARKKTRPTKASQRRRVDEKTKRGKQKALRRSKPSLD